jgi:hypothetical protein
VKVEPVAVDVTCPQCQCVFVDYTRASVNLRLQRAGRRMLERQNQSHCPACRCWFQIPDAPPLMIVSRGGSTRRD